MGQPKRLSPLHASCGPHLRTYLWLNSDNWRNIRVTQRLSPNLDTVSWSSKQQSTVATSSTHTEYIAAAKTSKELVWVWCLLSELHEGMLEPTRLHIDNHATELLARNPVNRATTKHINVWYHFIRECVADGSVDLRLIRTNDMAANVLTKALAVTKHKCFCQMLGMETMP